ncbi:MAG: DNA repair protein RecN [Candidatus Delongbacteria bacterium]|jgi:DNA repair protein RecN (Recombination protein N)|nr:DNA repair protein RecN [Candidatus Delongbacteria bacterium]
MLLSKLTINNLAIIDHLEFSPQDGLNILTGETGSGKSIIIASLNLILGNKIDKTLIRTGEDKLSVEAEFTNIDEDIKSILNFNDYLLFEDPLIIRRELNTSNRSRAFINDSPVKIDILSEIGKKLIDVHGQHEHQSLLDKNNHLAILDNYLDINTGGISKIYFKLINFRKELEKTIREENDLKDKKELLDYHKKEIEEISPETDEDVLVDKELRELENIEGLKKTSDQIDQITSGSAHSILTSIDILKKKCDELSDINPEFKEFDKDIDTAYTTFSEFNDSASRYVGGLEFDEERFSYLNNRLTKLTKIKKKFGPEISDVINHLEEINSQLNSIDNISFDIEKLNKVIKETEEQIKIACIEISNKRKKGSIELLAKINREFKDVGLSAAEINFIFNEKDISENGMDDVELFIRTNIGEDSKPLSKIVSGGEVSRIMLAIKNIISKKKGINILIFDEIDSGISGRIAEKVGAKLEALSMNKQLFVITHLPAIAQKGIHHFSVRKEVNNNKTTVKIKKLEGSDRLKEIDSLVSGDKTTKENKLDKNNGK